MIQCHLKITFQELQRKLEAFINPCWLKQNKDEYMDFGVLGDMNSSL